MQVIINNIYWMGFNSYLAVIPVLAGWLFYVTKGKIRKWIFGIIWLAYLPNTIYIITDLQHIPQNWAEVGNFGRIILIFEYIVLEITGILSFIFALYPFEKVLKTSRRIKNKQNTREIIIILNFLIGFGMVLGRIERINSWDILTQIQRVYAACVHVFQVPQLLFLALLYGLTANVIYFTFAKPIINFFSIDK